MTRTATFTIPANRTYTFENNLRKLNKKAVTLRADAKFTATVGNPYKRTLEVDEIGNKITAMFVDVEVTGSDFSVGGHTLVAMADFDDVENPTFTDFADDNFSAYREITRECEHCNTNRPRRKMFILKNESGDYVQVGKSCLKDYLGHSIFDAVKGCSLWTGLVEFEESLYGDMIKSVDFGDSLDHVVAVAVAQIRENGYTSRAEADEKWTKATADQVRDNLTYKPTEEEKAEAALVIEWANEEFVEKYADCTDGTNGTMDTRPSDSFTINMQMILENGRVTQKMIGFAACLPSLKARAEAKAARAEANGKSEHFGQIKQRLDIDVQVVAVTYIDSQFGTTSLYTMMSGSNIVKWFSSRDVLEKGKTYKLKATIKAHDEFNGAKQTVVTRCKVQ